MSPFLGTVSRSGDSVKIVIFSDRPAHFTTQKRMLNPVEKMPVRQDLNLLCCIKQILCCNLYIDVGQTLVSSLDLKVGRNVYFLCDFIVKQVTLTINFYEHQSPNWGTKF